MNEADEEQVKLMSEECIVIDADDNVLGHETKKNCHLNSNIFGPKNLLHRAFSAFVFNSKGEVLMQKRSDDKITFPAFWANSCCSHPLFFDEEMELNDALGVKRAARRKILQELGIPPEQLPLESFHFITRIHYKAKSDEIWGEHEIDHILFCVPPKDVTPQPNPNEVAEARYFSMEALNDFVDSSDDNNVLISPWFRAIHRSFLNQRWEELVKNGVQSVQKSLDTIQRVGMAASVGEEPQVVRCVDGSLKKQGAYGKVPIHKESLLKQAMRLNEVLSMVQMKASLLFSKKNDVMNAEHLIDSYYVKKEQTNDHRDQLREDLAYCDKMLGKTSRSFTLVIRQLPEYLRLVVSIFYLALRALDTIEDDCVSFSSKEDKIKHLKSFHKLLSQTDPSACLKGVGEAYEQELLENFHRIANLFDSLLQPEDQDVIRDITIRMANGMAEFVSKDMKTGTDTVQDYNLYCYYVAGLVGEGLTSLFGASKLEDSASAERIKLSHEMGLFLQKVNITRDFLKIWLMGGHFGRKMCGPNMVLHCKIWPIRCRWETKVRRTTNHSLRSMSSYSMLCNMFPTV